MKRGFVGLAAAVLLLVTAVRTPGQEGYGWFRFEQYLEALRQQAGIPGLSVVILQDRRVVWEKGLGLQDVDERVAAAPDTLYHLAGLTTVLSSTLVLSCIERGDAGLNDPIRRYVPSFPTPSTTIGDLLAHINDPSAPQGAFRHDLSRFSALGAVVEACDDRPFRVSMGLGLFDRAAMTASVPGMDAFTASSSVLEALGDATLARYRGSLRHLATPYRVSGNGKATPSSYPTIALSASTGALSTARDLASFDAALDRGQLLRGDMLQRAWTRASVNGAPQAHGLGWFVQIYNGELIVWQFGIIPDVGSAFVLKIPGRQLSFILLANSDGLVAPFSLSSGDVTTSLFARLFLRLFV